MNETRKTRGGLISGEVAYNRMYLFCLQVNGPITGGLLSGVGGGGGI